MKTKTTLLKEFSFGQRAFLSFLFTLFFIISSAQVKGDFRSNAITANWNTPGTWQVYDGSGWINTTAIPGKVADSYGKTDYMVTISNAPPFNTITFDIAGNYNFGNLIINGKLIVSADITLPTTENTLIEGVDSELNWGGKFRLRLPQTDATLTIIGYSVNQGGSKYDI